MNVNMLLIMLILSVLLYSNTRSDSLETVTKSGKWVVVSENGRKLKNEKPDMKIMKKHLQKIEEVLINQSRLEKKKQKKAVSDTIKFQTLLPGKAFKYQTTDNRVFHFENDEIRYARVGRPKPRPQTKEEMLYFNEHGKLPDSWATVSVDSAKKIVTTFLQETLKVDDFELFDSVDVRHISYEYEISYSVRLGDFCGIRRHTVKINANTGEIRSYTSINEHYSDFEPGYVPKITRDEAVRILKSDQRFLGVTVVDLEGKEQTGDNKPDFEISRLCLLPLPMQRIKIPGKDGWAWRALITIPDTIGVLFHILIDSDTGDILYFDPGLGPRN